MNYSPLKRLSSETRIIVIRGLKLYMSLKYWTVYEVRMRESLGKESGKEREDSDSTLLFGKIEMRENEIPFICLVLERELGEKVKFNCIITVIPFYFVLQRTHLILFNKIFIKILYYSFNIIYKYHNASLKYILM